MGLSRGDLVDSVYKVIDIDSHKSKMGPDNEVITICFSTNNRQVSEDLVQFCETGYSFVLDADATPGEQSDGTYKVFVEIERTKDAIENILTLIYGVQNLTNLSAIRFRYHKNFRSRLLNAKNLKKYVPLTPENYDKKLKESVENNYKNFFDKSYVDSVEMIDDTIAIRKKYSEPIFLKFIDFGDTVKTIESIAESFNTNDFAEIIFLTKYIGDYNITKYGNKITLENNGKTLVTERL